MKKCFVFAIILLTSLICYADDTQNFTKSGSGYDNFMIAYIGKVISVSVINNDMNIEGKLLAIYSDAILIETNFLKNKMFIPKTSIILIKIKEKSEN